MVYFLEGEDILIRIKNCYLVSYVGFLGRGGVGGMIWEILVLLLLNVLYVGFL